MDMKLVDEIHSICKKYKIKDYTINDDGSIDVEVNVELLKCDLYELPLTFNKVGGTFDCSDNNLTSLKGSPKEVGVNFYCYKNNLTSLKDSPTEIRGDFFCDQNSLTSLEHGPELVGYDYDCAANYLTDLKGAPRKIGYVFDCRDNKLTTLEGSPDYIDGSFQCSHNFLTDLKNGPEEITGHLICSGNQINSLEFYPKVNKTFELHGNPIGSLFDSFDPDLDVIKAFNSYRVLKDGVVIIKRLKYLMSTFNQPIDLEEIEKHYKVK
jgi:hypothetical protein